MTAIRRWVTSTDGRAFTGTWPQSVRTPGEGPYIAALGRQLSGACEVTLACGGRADVLTADTAFEVEPVRSWRRGLRQALSYAASAQLAPGLALFGDIDYLPIYLHLRDKLPQVRLWRWNRNAWQHVTSRRVAKQATSTTPPTVYQEGTQQ